MIKPLRPVRVTFSYVLVLEWLGPGDRKTGSELYERLTAWKIPAKLVVCDSGEDIYRAIMDATANVSRDGIPAVHLETHGDDLERDPEIDPGFVNGHRRVLWEAMGSWLSKLNARCGYEVLFVGASCWSGAARAAMGTNQHSAPFAACVGFSTRVTDGSLFDAMRELYSALNRNEDLREAVEAAQRELRSADEKLEVFTCLLVAYIILESIGATLRDPAETEARVRRVLDEAESRGIQVIENAREVGAKVWRERAPFRMKEAWDCWFPSQLQQENPNYRLDWAVLSLGEEDLGAAVSLRGLHA
jgi:hypothetical protein